MKKLAILWTMLLFLGFLSACELSNTGLENSLTKEPEKPILVLTYVEDLDDALVGFLKQPFTIANSLDEVQLSEFERVLVLYDEQLRTVFPPALMDGPRLIPSHVVTFTHPEGIEITMVYLEDPSEYQEMLSLLDKRIFELREHQLVYTLYPLKGVSGRVESNKVDQQLLLQQLPPQAQLVTQGENLRWFYTSEEVYIFLEDLIPSYLRPYADQLITLNQGVEVFVNERGQRIVVGRATGPFSSDYYDSFLKALSDGISAPVTLSPIPPTNVNLPQSRVAPPTACYTRDLRGTTPQGPPIDSNTVSHEIPVNRIPSIGNVVGLVVMIGFDEFDSVVSDEQYRSIIEHANDYADAFYEEMSQGLISFEWVYYPEVVTVPFFLGPEINAGTPGYMDLLYDHIYLVLEQVETEMDLSSVDFISFFWPLGLPDYVGDGLAEQLSERMNTKRGNIYNFILQKVTINRERISFVVTHEIAHNLGLTDTYIHPWVPEFVGKPHSYKYGYWDLMADSNELKAWHRWILSWMPDEQVYCLPDTSAKEYEVFLEPLNNIDADVRQIVISLNETEAISIELRGPGTFCPSECNQNILATHIDTNIGNGNGPMFILRPERAMRRDQSDSLIRKGESVQFRNITITHQERYAAGSIVSIRFDE